MVKARDRVVLWEWNRLEDIYHLERGLPIGGEQLGVYRACRGFLSVLGKKKWGGTKRTLQNG